jgi:uncharacterized protein YegP (UPF0339 family)
MLILQIVLAVVVALVAGVAIGFLITRPPRVTGVSEVREPREPEFEIYKDMAGKFRFRLIAPNREIIAVGEAYESKAGCKNGIESVKENAPKAIIVDLTKPAT